MSNCRTRIARKSSLHGPPSGQGGTPARIMPRSSRLTNTSFGGATHITNHAVSMVKPSPPRAARDAPSGLQNSMSAMPTDLLALPGSSNTLVARTGPNCSANCRSLVLATEVGNPPKSTKHSAGVACSVGTASVVQVFAGSWTASAVVGGTGIASEGAPPRLPTASPGAVVEASLLGAAAWFQCRGWRVPTCEARTSPSWIPSSSLSSVWSASSMMGPSDTGLERRAVCRSCATNS
mmetsp:Transcript_86083/g.278067  ORF Transcript_86083/g.278067 Transcript_86083/m.278067 type:complete len:236 (+) Transcript_86083:321-1028(+)